MESNPKPEKTNLHPRNAHRFGYDFDALAQTCPDLTPFVQINKHQMKTIDFSNPHAVKMLNKALLQQYYQVEDWDIPSNYLCPAIPGRADYIHHIADLLALSNNGIIPKGARVTGLDIGTGSSVIYPTIGHSIYKWDFIATDVDGIAMDNVTKLLERNPELADHISLQQQINPKNIFKGIILAEDRFAFTICNPPFHISEAEAMKGTLRKISNLHHKKTATPVLNFGGQESELWCEGGELAFITQMIFESVHYATQCLWFTTLVSKATHLAEIYKILTKVKAFTVKTLDVAQGQKTSRIVAWSFLSEDARTNWQF